jgi:hypothetical protein
MGNEVNSQGGDSNYERREDDFFGLLEPDHYPGSAC